MTELSAILQFIVWIGYLSSSVVISFRDLKTHQVRNLDVAVTGAFILTCSALISIFANTLDAIISSSALGLFFGSCYFFLHRISQGQLGAGDIGLAALLGQMVGLFNWSLVWIGLAMPFVLAAPFALVLLLFRGRASRFAFAPFIMMSVVPTLFLGTII